MTQLATSGAVQGGLSGFGFSERQGGELLADTAAGIGLGAAADKLAPVVGKGIQSIGKLAGKAADPLSDVAVTRGLESLEINPLRFGEEGFEAQRATGRALLDENLLGGSRQATVNNLLKNAETEDIVTNAGVSYGRSTDMARQIKDAPYKQQTTFDKLLNVGVGVGGLGAAAAHPLTAVPLLAYKAAGSTTGKRLQAITANGLANTLRDAPEMFGKYGKVIQNVIQTRGPEVGNAMHHVLMQRDPEYRKMMMEDGNDN